jgi:hypothetical protein
MDPRLRIPSLVTTLALAGVAAALLAAPASAQKGVLGIGADPATGIVDPAGNSRYTTLWAGDGTVIEKLDTGGGTVEASTYLDRRLAVPSVSYDQTAGGLSADGEALVLMEPGIRFPQTRSDFTVFDTQRLRVLDTVSLEGTWTFDALSPNGRWLYLIEYTSPRDLTEYLVRRYDLRRGELLSKPIVDPNEENDDMYGTPLTRATGVSGRWEYTLYDGAEHPFIHALNTQRGTAVCIDLDQLEGRNDLYRLDLQPSLDGSTLAVAGRGAPVATVDLTSFEVSEPPVPAAEVTDAPDSADGLSWALIAGGGALLIAVAGVLVRRRCPDGVDEAELERLVALGRDSRDDEEAREREPVA